MSGPKQLGVTPPMNENLPTEAEKRASDALVEELRRQKTFESPSDTQKRHQVLASLQSICNEFVKKVATVKEPKNEVLIRNARGKIYTYGSFRLGVFGPGSDIDTLVVAPKYVTRDDYFDYFPDLLTSMAPEGAISDLAAVRDAYVPIIKFEYSGISIDLIFSRIIQKQLPPDLDLKDSNVLRGLDEQELRSLNGTRVTDEILSLVPEESTFKLALRVIKRWAQRRAVYANIVGFPGGVAWAMMVARVCQLYPKAAVSVIILKFFTVYKGWNWPQPVLLKPIEDGPLPVRIWNPKVYPQNRSDLMPVITPAYPSMCATFNVSHSTKSIIQDEIVRGLDITLQIMGGQRPWSDLFVKHTFFTKDHKYFMTVISAGIQEASYKLWSGWVESRVRHLVSKLERAPGIMRARPFIKSFERRHLCKSEDEVKQAREGSLLYLAPPNLEGAEANGDSQPNGVGSKGEGVTELLTCTQYIGLELGEDTKSFDLSWAVEEFDNMCKAWPKYQGTEKEGEPGLQNEVFLSLQAVKRVNLPDDVFEPGERKATKKATKKRAAPEEQNPPAKRQQASAEG